MNIKTIQFCIRAHYIVRTHYQFITKHLKVKYNYMNRMNALRMLKVLSLNTDT